MPTSTAPSRQPRLKETCDRCSIAKVRCSRDKNCTRCVSKGLPCVYSLSRRAGRRHGPKKGDFTKKERSTSSTPPPSETDSTPISPENDMDALYSWEFPMQSTGDLNSTLSSQLTLNNELYEMNDSLLQQPINYFPTMTDTYSTLISPHTIVAPEYPNSFNTSGLPAEAPTMHRSPTCSSSLSADSTSSINSSQVDSVHDELTNLTEFAERMEQKFDAVVRQRLQYRNMCSEFGVPEELEVLDGAECVLAQDAKKGPDLAEMSFYYSLAELRRRLKWLREDVGNMIQPGVSGMDCR